jgi:hypothetical protein
MKKIVDSAPKRDIVVLDEINPHANYVLGYIVDEKEKKLLMLGYRDVNTFHYFNLGRYTNAISITIKNDSIKEIIRATKEKFSDLKTSDFVLFDDMPEAIAYAHKLNNSQTNE